MTGDLATRWANTVVPSWLYRWLLPAVWVIATVVSLSTAGDMPCSVEDPTICGPDPAFSLLMVPLLATLVLWWWQPSAAAVTGVLFTLLGSWYDGAAPPIEWTLYACACTALLVWMIVSRRQQLALTAGLPRRQVMVPPAGSVGLTSRLLVAGVLVLVGAAALGVMRWQDQREEVHLQRAVEQTGVVKSETADGDLVLQLPDGSTRTVTMYDDYATGAGVPVLIDPADSDWLRPRAEPADYTFWYTVAGGVWLLAILLVLRDVRLRRARPRRSWTAPALPVRVEPDASTAFAIQSADGAVLLGFLDAELDDDEADARLFDAFDVLDEDEEAPAALKREWAQTLRRYRGEALLVGDLAEGSWPTVVLGDRVLRPVAPLRAPRRMPWRTESVAGLPKHLETSDTPNQEPPRTVPVHRSRLWGRLRGDPCADVVAPVPVAGWELWVAGWADVFPSP